MGDYWTIISPSATTIRENRWRGIVKSIGTALTELTATLVGRAGVVLATMFRTQRLKKPSKVPKRGWVYATYERMKKEIDKGMVIFGDDETADSRVSDVIFSNAIRR